MMLCAMYAQCGQKSPFSPPLNCAVSKRPVKPSLSHLNALERVCGKRLADSHVCCDEAQLSTLSNSIKMAEKFINPCPACWQNFLTFWCEFTCAPNQSSFVNVTATERLESTGKDVVTEVDFWVSSAFGEAFFRSCQDIKFGSDNRFAMEFVGGGASNYSEFFRFMGEPKPEIGGSPFRINFPNTLHPPTTILPLNPTIIPCNTSDTLNRCSCFDCADACPLLAPVVTPPQRCTIGNESCFAFISLITYLVILTSLISYLLYRAIVNGSLWNSLLGYHRVSTVNQVNDNDLLTISEQLSSPLPLFSSQPSVNKTKTYKPLQVIEKGFYSIGKITAQYPLSIISMNILIIALSTYISIFNLKFATNPVDLWVSPTSTALAEKQYFDNNFGPFYRISQLFFTINDSTLDNSTIVHSQNIQSLFDIQTLIRNLKSTEYNVSLTDLCFKPLKQSNHNNDQGCVIQSVTGYWQDDISTFNLQTHDNTWREHLTSCITNPAQFECLPIFQQPLRPNLLFGATTSLQNTLQHIDHQSDKVNQWMQSQAFVVTIVNNNSLNETWLKMSEDWEKSLVNLLLTIRNDNNQSNGITLLQDMNISFSTESSIETELRKSTSADIPTIITSYIVMFIYITIALGRHTKLWTILRKPSLCREFVVHSKVLLGFISIILVISSLSISTGLLSLLHVRATYIVAEVIPFLILAIGVDNTFIIVNEFERQSIPLSIEGSILLPIQYRIAQTLGKVGPSILLSSLAETSAFLIGALVPMPAVSSFCLYSAVAVLANLLLQVTCFVAFLTLDAHRSQRRGMDCLPCLFIPPLDNSEDSTQEQLDYNQSSFLDRLFDRYSHCLAIVSVQRIVLAMTGLTTLLALAFIFEIQLGLDQREALPQDSYLVSYFNDMDIHLQVGPPLYFVAQHVRFTERSGQVRLCARFTECNTASLPTMIEQERKNSNTSFIAEPPGIWLDDFFFWLQPNEPDPFANYAPSCCSYHRDQPDVFCDENDDLEMCVSCVAYEDWKITNMTALPEGHQFERYVQHWLNTAPTINCPLAGAAAYANVIDIQQDNQTSSFASHFRTYYTPLKGQHDFIAAQAASRRIAKELSTLSQVDTFAYSVFHVYFEQYEYIVRMTLQTIGLAITAIFLVSLSVLGSLRESALLALSLTLIAIYLAGGVLGMAGVSLNAISAVNLVMGIGLSVEFCAHLVKSYLVQRGNRAQRVNLALIEVGPSIVTGIGLTKIVGISVLAFAHSALFRQYYFKMYVGIVSIAIVVGLVVLPVLLIVFGGDTSLVEHMSDDHDGVVFDIDNEQSSSNTPIADSS